MHDRTSCHGPSSLLGLHMLNLHEVLAGRAAGLQLRATNQHELVNPDSHMEHDDDEPMRCTDAALGWAANDAARCDAHDCVTGRPLPVCHHGTCRHTHHGITKACTRRRLLLLLLPTSGNLVGWYLEI